MTSTVYDVHVQCTYKCPDDDYMYAHIDLQETHEEVQVVQAFLLNDSLMLAAHIRRRKGPVRYRFQALYELDNMAVVEVKDMESLKNAFKILMFPNSHLYQVKHVYTKYMYMYMYITIETLHSNHM